MTEWYFSANNIQTGPLTDKATITTYVRENPGAHCWSEGMDQWQPAHEVTAVRLFKKDGVTPFPPPNASMMSPKPESLPVSQKIQEAPQEKISHSNAADALLDSDSNQSEGFGGDYVTEGIDFKIYGHEMQYLELELDEGESAVAEAGAMMYKTEHVEMETVFGDDSSQGVMGNLMSAGRRLLTSESLFVTVFTQSIPAKGIVAFAAPFPGTILALDLKEYDGKLICQKDSFLAGARGVQVGIHFQKRILTGLFGGDGFILQKLEGTGMIFVHMGGAIRKVELKKGETLHVDTGCLAAMTSTVDYDVQQAGGVKSMLFGGEGLFFATLKGPGTVWLQSLPFSRLAGRMLSGHSQGQGEGSVLGSIGNLLGGR